MVTGAVQRPFFTVAVTTYDRVDLLRQTLASILNQTFGDFELLVGNDHGKRFLTAEEIVVEDPRVRIINHPHNLGEVGNMNALLSLGQGEYFTWVFDDDLCARNFLETIHRAVVDCPATDAVFTGYRLIVGGEDRDPGMVAANGYKKSNGAEFLRSYLSSATDTMPSNGVFATESLRRIGGVQNLCDAPIGWQAENLLAVQCGLLRQILFIDGPLQIHRYHEGSFGAANVDVGLRLTAGKNLICRSIETLQSPALIADFEFDLRRLIMLVLKDIARTASFADADAGFRRVRPFLRDMRNMMLEIEDASLRRVAIRALRAAVMRSPGIAAKNIVKAIVRRMLTKAGLIDRVRAIRHHDLRAATPTQHR